MRKYRGRMKLVLKPCSTDEVSKILKYCNDKMLAVVPQGGNSGLVGGSVPIFDKIVINMSRMNVIRDFYEVLGALVVDAGCILEVADAYLKERSYIFPLDLGTKGSCQIGGNVATNAGGLRLIRYGSLHGSVLGIEAVLPDGTIMNDLSKLRKNNTGYDLKQLFIGAEGTIGIITGISVQCYPFYCFIETSGFNPEHDQEKLENFLESVLDKEIAQDGVLAQDETQMMALWGWREGIPESLGHWGAVYKYDLSIPTCDLYALVDDVRHRINSAGLLGDSDAYPAVSVVGYGHMGDSNLHLNIAARSFEKQLDRVLELSVYEWVGKRNGSISAEHGLGLSKKNIIGYSRDDTMIQLMKQIKNSHELQHGILNPY
ncbi:BgTH12-07430 [Blumeria graminis f. sp. triticale]|uniref:BgTH12-07430 n=1 Tax=Blumeria graminis f. sp. triticale TaxID=1689686 RepID=A0A9W4DEC9_BLUGR|nr:BgTH12-07430 [Blumeria graminis f. sp. triticale]